MDHFTQESVFDLAQNFRLSRQAEPEPFFAISEPCQHCGRPTGGIDCPCQLEEHLPIEPRCPIEYRLVLAAETVAALSYQVKIHRLTCPICNGQRKQPGRQVQQARKAA